MAVQKVYGFSNYGKYPEKVGDALLVPSHIAKCSYLNCQNNLASGSYCTFHARRHKEICANFRQRQAADFSKVSEFECVYIIGSEFFEPVKIGRSAAPLRRLSDMQVGNPYQLKVFAAFLMTKVETVFLEWDVHVSLYGMGFGVSGEWFDLDHNDAKAVIAKCAAKAGVDLRTPGQALRAIASSDQPYSPEPEWLSFRDRLQALHRALEA